jgi:peroxiredoxin
MADTGSNIGQLAPEIDLLDGNRERWMLSGARGKVVAPFFYPGDESPVCTKPMCSARMYRPRMKTEPSPRPRARTCKAESSVATMR